MSGRWRWLSLLLLALLLLALPASAGANLSAPWIAGELLAEPDGELRALTILGEELRLDLRPLARGEPALVRVSYRVRGPATGRRVRLVFVTPGIERGKVRVDGADVAGRRELRPLPERWRGFLEAELQELLPRQLATLEFELQARAGAEHRLEVEAALRPGARLSRSHPYRTNELLYLLEPARQWQSFGGLTVSAELPPGWEAQTRPDLERRGDRLEGRFVGLPADLLVISTRRPADRRWGGVLVIAGLVLGLAVGIWLSRRVGRGLGGRGAGLAVPVGLLLSLPLALLPSALAWGGVLLWQQLLDPHQLSRHFLHGPTMLLFVLTPLVGLVLLGVELTLFLLAWRRARAGRVS